MCDRFSGGVARELRAAKAVPEAPGEGMLRHRRERKRQICTAPRLREFPPCSRNPGITVKPSLVNDCTYMSRSASERAKTHSNCHRLRDPAVNFVGLSPRNVICVTNFEPPSMQEISECNSGSSRMSQGTAEMLAALLAPLIVVTIVQWK